MIFYCIYAVLELVIIIVIIIITMSSQNYRIVLIGSARVGKTALINRHIYGEFNKNYVATIGEGEHKLRFNTNYGVITFDIIDCGAKEIFNGNEGDHYVGANAAIIMFDVTSKYSYTKAHDYVNLFRSVEPYGKIVICGNKCDEKGRTVKPRDINIHRQFNCNYYDISAKTNYNFDKPFLNLARKLTGHDDLYFTEGLPIMPKEIKVDWFAMEFPDLDFSYDISNKIKVVNQFGKILEIDTNLSRDDKEILKYFRNSKYDLRYNNAGLFFCVGQFCIIMKKCNTNLQELSFSEKTYSQFITSCKYCSLIKQKSSISVENNTVEIFTFANPTLLFQSIEDIPNENELQALSKISFNNYVKLYQNDIINRTIDFYSLQCPNFKQFVDKSKCTIKSDDESTNIVVLELKPAITKLLLDKMANKNKVLNIFEELNSISCGINLLSHSVNNYQDLKNIISVVSYILAQEKTYKSNYDLCMQEIKQKGSQNSRKIPETKTLNLDNIKLPPCSRGFLNQLKSPECLKCPQLVQFIDPITDNDAEIRNAITKLAFTFYTDYPYNNFTIKLTCDDSLQSEGEMITFIGN